MRAGKAYARWRRLILAVLIALVAVAAACQSESGSAQAPRVGAPAPAFQLPALNGEPVSLDSLKGRAVMLNFWASWCDPCLYEMPYIQEVHSGWSERGLVVLAVNIGESPARVREFMESSNLSFPVLLDESGEVAQRYHIRGIPATFFLDKGGIIQSMRVGPFPSRAAIEGDLAKVIP